MCPYDYDNHRQFHDSWGLDDYDNHWELDNCRPHHHHRQFHHSWGLDDYDDRRKLDNCGSDHDNHRKLDNCRADDYDNHRQFHHRWGLHHYHDYGELNNCCPDHDSGRRHHSGADHDHDGRLYHHPRRWSHNKWWRGGWIRTFFDRNGPGNSGDGARRWSGHAGDAAIHRPTRRVDRRLGCLAGLAWSAASGGISGPNRKGSWPVLGVIANVEGFVPEH